MPVNVRIPDDLRDRIDAVRGKVKREPWIRAALSALVATAEHRDDALKRTPYVASHDDTGAKTDG